MAQRHVHRQLVSLRLLLASALLSVIGIPAVLHAQAGLVAAWNFNEGSGTSVADATGNNNTGTFSGPTWVTQGRYGNALNFDGVNDLVVVNSSSLLNLGAAMTLSAWVYPTASQTGWRAIVQREVDGYFLHAGNHLGGLRPTGGGIFGGNNTYIQGTTAVAVNTWTHLAVTYDGAMLRVFANGVQVASSPQTGTIETSSNPLRIGGNSPYGEFFQGRIDDVRIYNRALTSTEIQSDMAVSVGPADTTVPVITITGPTSNPTTTVTSTPLTVSGTASDNVGVTQVTWVNDRGGSGTATGTTSWSASVALQSGANVITVTARDAANNTATDVITVTYNPPDVTAPAVTITGPTSNPTTTVTATPLSISGTASDNVAVTQVTWSNDRGGSGTATGTTAWSVAGIVLLSGNNVITVTARDAANNTATDVITVTYNPPDVTAPAVTITGPTSNPTHTVTTTPLSISGTASDNVAVTQVTWSNDRGGSGTATGTTAWSVTGIVLLSGDNVITVTARDAANNTATDVITVTYNPPDVTAPGVTITGPTSNPTHTVTTTPLSISGTASDNVAVTQVTWSNDRGGSGTATGTTAWSVTGIVLLSGDNVITVTARDAANNTATDVITVTYNPPDATLPTITITGPTSNPTHTVTVTPLTLSGTASDNVAVTLVTWTNNRGGSGSAAGTTSWTTTSIALQSGDNILTVTASDAAGNSATDVITVTYNPSGTPAGLVAAWAFNEGVGASVADAAGNNNVGTISGAAWSALGRNGNALSFDGVNDVVQVNSSASLNVTTGLTISAWVFPTANLTGWRAIVQREVDAYHLHASNDQGGLRPATGGHFDTNGSVLRATNAIPANDWTHLAMTYDGANLRLFVNGVQVASKAQTGVVETNTKPLRIGGNFPYDEFFQGRIDDVRIYNRALSVAEIQTDMAVPVGGGPPPDVTAPGVTITGPTPNPTHTVTSTPLSISGTASDNVAVTQVTWSNDRGGSGTATGTTAWSVSGIVLQSGDNVITVTARDAANNTATDVITVTYNPPDVTAPGVTITGPTSNPTHTVTSTPLSISGTASDNVAVTQVTWSNDRGGSGTATGTTAWSVSGIVLQSGDNVITVTARDAANNTATDVITVTYNPPDVTAPGVTITGPTSNPTHTVTSTPLSISGTASDNVAVTQVTWSNDRGGSGTATGTTAWSVSGIVLQSGDNVITVTARDAANNTATDVITVTYNPPDVTAPGVTITGPTSNPTHTVTSTPLSISGTASDNVAVTQVTWSNDRGGSGTATGTTSWTVSGIVLQSGDNVITVTARDAANNTATDVITVTYNPPDVTAPGVTITGPTSNPTHTVTSTPLSISGTASDNVAVTQVTWSNDRGGSGTATGTTAWSVSGIVLQSGDNVITVTAQDAANNTATDVITVTYNPPDVTAPGVTITGPTSNPTHTVTSTPLSISGTASDNVAVTQVTWSNDRGGSGTATGTTAWSASVALQSGDNVITVTAQDAANNTATDVITVTYNPPDVTAPGVTITGPTSNPTHTVTSTPLSISGTASDNVAVTQVTWSNDRGGSGTATGTTAWSVSGIVLQSGDNVITVTARDAANNTATDVITVTYNPPDVTAPGVTITGPTSNPTHTVTSTPLSISGTASDNVAVTQVTWSNDRGGSGTATGTTAWSVSGIVLQSGDNVITVTARDAANNTATDVITVTYNPPAPTGLVAGWNFNEGTGSSVADVSGNNNTGTVQGAGWTTQGRNGNALTFDGVNDIVLVNSSTSLNLTTGLTVSAWVYPTANQTGWRAIVQREVDAWFLHASNDGGALRPAVGGTFNGSGTAFQAPSAIGVNTWTHLAMTYDGANLRLFVNGTQVASQTQSGALETNTSPLRIGGNSPYVEFFQGRIDDIRIYNRALSAAEIQTDMTVGVGPDVTAPGVTITGPTSNPTTSVTTTPLTLSGTASDNLGVTQVTWSNDRGGSGTATGTTSWSASGIVLQSGDNVITVTARDAANNTATDVITVTYTPPETVPPAITITGPTSNPSTTVTTSPINLSGSASDNLGVTQVTWSNDRGGAGAATGTTSWSVSGIVLQSGDNVITVTARDAANNSASDVITVTYNPPPDITAPSIAILVPTSNPTTTVGATPVTVSGTASDDVAVTQVSWSNDRGGSGTASGTTAWTASGIALQSGDNVVTVTARDAAGNVAIDVITVTYTAPSAPLGLVAAWGFNSLAGTNALDDSGNGNNGTVQGATWTTQGRNGNALLFDGVNDIVLVPSSASLNLTTGLTLSAWVYPTANQSGWRAIVQREVDAYHLHASNDGGALRPAAGGTFGGVGNIVQASSAISVNTWTHLAMSYDGANIRLFVNGTQVASRPQIGALETNTNPLRIGGNSPYVEFFQGRIDDVRIYNRAMSEWEIQGDMTVGVGTGTPRLVLIQPADGNSIQGTTVAVKYTATGDLSEVDHVHFQLDSNSEVMDLSLDGAYQFTNVPVGQHVLRGYLVRANHSKILNTDAIVSFETGSSSDTTPPTVSVTSPIAGSNLTGFVTVAANAADNSGTVAGVQFFLDGVALGAETTTAPFTYAWNTVTTTNGPHTITARARDIAGNQTTSAPIAVTVSNSASADPAVVGLWSQFLDWPLVAIHMNLMANGKILVWDDHTSGEGAGVFDPATNTMTLVPFSAANLFCAGHNLLPDGSVFVVGGHISNHVGLTNGTRFNPTTQTWTSTQPMVYGRWYPTVTALPDGRMLTLGGEVNCDNCNALLPEVFNPTTGTWTTLTGAPLNLPYYPHAFVLPDGRVIVTGANKLEMATYALNVATQTWTTIDPTVLHAGSSVMYAPGKFMKSGRGRDPDLSGSPSVATTYVLDMNVASPLWRQTAAMAFPRTQHNLTLLADGTVLATGGGVNSDVFDPNAPVLTPELWDPVLETWKLMAPMATPRIYHSTAVLLPDGRVISAGGGRWGPSYLSAEYYSPPYLFKGPRPTISSAPSTITYGSDFFVGTPNATSIATVHMIRLGSVTHAFNANQQIVKLNFVQTAGGLTVTAPSGSTLAPPGHYMLFILDGIGVPSVAPILKIQ